MVHWPKFFWRQGGLRKFFLRALFFSKSAPRSLAPPTFRSFLRPWTTLQYDCMISSRSYVIAITRDRTFITKMKLSNYDFPDWKVWKLHNRDFENLIVPLIFRKHQSSSPDIRVGCAIQTFHTGWLKCLGLMLLKNHAALMLPSGLKHVSLCILIYDIWMILWYTVIIHVHASKLWLYQTFNTLHHITIN
jgi:hypothetical protein